MNISKLTLAFGLGALATAHADDKTLPLVVHGDAVDAVGLTARISAELGAPIALASRCGAPCLDVRVAGSKATVVFTPVHGAPRERTVELGKDGAQWPLVITLLAGNVVRDEASDVLATLPAVGPAPAPPPAPPEATPEPDEAPPAQDEQAPETAEAQPEETPELEATPAPDVPEKIEVTQEGEEHPWMFLNVGLVPGLSTDWTHIGSVRHFLSLGLIAGVNGGSSGVAISGVADIQRGTVGGLQLGGVVTIARRVLGVQLAGVAAVANDVDGFQIGGVASVADRADAVQLAGVATVADRAATQVAGVATVSKGEASTQIAGVAAHAATADLQIAGVAAHASGRAPLQLAGVATVADASRLQVAGVANVSSDANVQVAGVVNVADHVSMQIGTINVAERVSGAQIGVINVSHDPDGTSFGLINIVPGGRYDVEGAVDSSRVGTVLFRHGGNGWHNVYGIGGHPVDEKGPSDDVWMYGLGFGPSFRLRHARVDLEGIAWQVNHGVRHSTDVSILAQARLTVAYGLGPIALVGGAAFNTYISNDQESPLILERRVSGEPMSTNRDVTVTMWPSFFLGVRL